MCFSQVSSIKKIEMHSRWLKIRNVCDRDTNSNFKASWDLDFQSQESDTQVIPSISQPFDLCLFSYLHISFSLSLQLTFSDDFFHTRLNVNVPALICHDLAGPEPNIDATLSQCLLVQIFKKGNLVTSRGWLVLSSLASGVNLFSNTRLRVENAIWSTG